MKHSGKVNANKHIVRNIIRFFFVLKAAFLCSALLFLIVLIKEGALSYPLQQTFDIRSAVIISLGFAVSILVMKQSTMQHSKGVMWHRKKV